MISYSFKPIPVVLTYMFCNSSWVPILLDEEISTISINCRLIKSTHEDFEIPVLQPSDLTSITIANDMLTNLMLSYKSP